jgi:5-methylcytosine-specific restriction protein A
MTIREGLLRVLSGYQVAMSETFAEHPLADFVRGGLCNAIEAAASHDGDGLVFTGSAGQGRWARGPWIGIFNPVVTSGAQKGYYPVYLFREDMRGVYLSLNQGMTEAKELYRSDAKSALLARAQNYRAMLGGQLVDSLDATIDLAPSSQSNATAFYEAGNICATYYPADDLPNEKQLVDDLRSMLALYGRLIESETDAEGSFDDVTDEPANQDIEDATRFRIHKRIERNVALVKKVKEKKGYSCEACGINFEQVYGPLGKGYIEAHHLKPLASLKGTKVAMNPEVDFAVLCSNCHRMVHRSGLVDDIALFKREHVRA